jgi:hypothetical protein
MMLEQPKEVFAVVYTETIHVEGDERSRTHPGHGYPAHTIEHQVFKEFKDENEFRAWIEDEMRPGRFGQPRKFRAFRCTPVAVTTEVKINIG